MISQLKYYLKKLIRQGFTFNQILKELKESQYFTTEQLEDLQNEKLRKLIQHCYKNVPYYTELFDKLNLKPEDIQTKEDLKKLPYLDKYIVKENFDKLIAKNRLKCLAYETKTSGTTGTPGKIMWDKASLAHEYATVARFCQNAGDNKLKRVILRGNFIKSVDNHKPPFWELNPVNNELIMSSYHLNQKTAQLYIEKIKEYNAEILYAYPSTAFLLAKYFKNSNAELNLKAVFTSSETLEQDKKEFIEETFNCSIYDWYGQVERVAAIGQCKNGTYHIQEDYSIVELLDTESGMEIVGTHLHNYIMPLIRYRTTDTIELSNEKCSCGCNFRQVSKIHGKNSNYYQIVTNEGTKVTSFGYIPMGVNNIIETQFIQEKIGELIINVTTNGKFSSKDKEQLIKNAKSRTSCDMKIIVNEVSEIPRGPNGKFQAVINKITNNIPSATNKSKIIMIGPDINSQGGIASVIKSYKENHLYSDKVIYLPSYKYKNIISQLLFYLQFLIQYICLLVKDNDIKLVHIHTASRGSFLRKSISFYIAKFFKKKVIINIHPINFINFYNNSSNLVKKFIENVLNKSDLILVLSKTIKTKLTNICQNSNIEILYNPVLLKEFHHISSDKIRIVFMGNLNKNKGVYDIIEAAKYIKNPNVIINLYGDGDLDEFKKLIAKNNLENKVKIKGWIRGEQKDIAFAESDIYILPSYTEGLPMSILEAMAAKLPVISTPIGGIPETIYDGVNGFLIQPGDCKALAEKIDLLANDKELREKMGQESYKIAKEKFDIEIIIKQLQEIYDDLINKPTPVKEKIKKHSQIKYYFKKFVKESGFFNKISNELRKSEFYSQEQLTELQNKQLQKLIKHCYKNVPYYKELFDSLNLKPKDIQTKDDLKKLPFLDKYKVRENYDKLIAKNIIRPLCYVGLTGGTTGTPGRFLRDYYSVNFENAITQRFYQTFGDKGLKRVTLREVTVTPVSQTKPPFWEYNLANNELIMSPYHLSKENAPYYVQKIIGFNPQILYLQPSSAYMLAEFFSNTKHNLNLKAIFTSSENLSDEKRKFIENVFKTQIHDWYGQAERVAAIGQCEKSENGTYHIIEDYSIVELLEEDGNYEICGTSLYNFAMPLLRYKTGDFVIPQEKKCNCGRHFREVKKIQGRNIFYILTPEHTKIMNIEIINMDVYNVIETQYIQEKLDELIINVVTNDKFNENDIKKLIQNVEKYISPNMKAKVNKVEHIPRNSRGKFINVIRKFEVDENLFLKD